MSSRKSWRALPALIAISLFISGCNAFEAFDRSQSKGDFAARLGEAKLELASANYANALDRFDRIIDENGSNDETWRGRAAAQAGLAGFNMFSVLDRLQNDVLVPDTAAVFFSASKLIKDTVLLNKAIDDMNRLVVPTNEDMLFRSLMSCLSACKALLSKYDTNLSGRLDTPDQITFTSRDDKTSKWPVLFTQLTVTSSAYSLEKAFIELSHAFDGRGTAWVMISPIQGISHTGQYTPANRSTILAAANFAEALKEINAWFDNSEDQFKTKLMLMDGAN